MEVTSLIAIAIAIAIPRHVVAIVVAVTLHRLPPSPTESEGKGCYNEISGKNLALRAPEAILHDISWPRPRHRCQLGMETARCSVRVVRRGLKVSGIRFGA